MQQHVAGYLERFFSYIFNPLAKGNCLHNKEKVRALLKMQTFMSGEQMTEAS